jgi:selenocysteine-specific elongation factor
LRRRGAARRRGAELAGVFGQPDPRAEIARRGAVTPARLTALGVLKPGDPTPRDILEVGDFLVDPGAWERWRSQLDGTVDDHRRAHPLEVGISAEAARQALAVPDLALMDALVAAAEGRLATARGRIFRPGSGPVFSPGVQASLDKVTARLDTHPFDAPDATELEDLGLTSKILAAASRLGGFLRLPGDILLSAVAVDEAHERLARLPQPFTVADTRETLGITRRIALPLLEHMDSLGLTVRMDRTSRRFRDG